MDISKITNLEAKRFLNMFIQNREINEEFYNLVPEDKFDFRMVDTPERKSDSPRESLIHQIYVTKNYIYSFQHNKIEWSEERYTLLMAGEWEKKDKTELLQELTKTEDELVNVLSNIAPDKSLGFLWGLDSHEVLHLGWNLALMDHLNIPRFESLKKIWG